MHHEDTIAPVATAGHQVKTNACERHALLITEIPHEVTGEGLRAMREGAGMSLRAMAWRVGCSHGHLARVEDGERALTRDMGHRISRAAADHRERIA